MVGGREGRGSLEGAGFAGRGRGLQPAAVVAQAQCGPCPGAIPSVSARRGEGRAGLWRAGPGRAGPGMAEKKQPVDLGLLEEDDEFEEFPAEGARRGWGEGPRGRRGLQAAGPEACLRGGRGGPQGAAAAAPGAPAGPGRTGPSTRSPPRPVPPRGWLRGA